MKTRLLVLLSVLALAGCSTFEGGTGTGEETTSYPPTDFMRGGNRANPPPFDTQSGAILQETDNMDLHGMDSEKFPPAHRY